MSSDAPHPPELPPAPPRPPAAQNGCLTILMGLVGAILLLPGVCGLLFGGAMLSEMRFDGLVLGLVLLGLVVGTVGLLLLRAAFRRHDGR